MGDVLYDDCRREVLRATAGVAVDAADILDNYAAKEAANGDRQKTPDTQEFKA